MFAEIKQKVIEANPERDMANAKRRAIKLIEELGEVAEAWLNITSPQNGKSKSWNDVREEIADCLIVVMDVALTTLPGENQTHQWFIQRELNTYAHFEQIIFSILLELAFYGNMIHAGNYTHARVHINRAVVLTAELNMMPMPDQPDANIEFIEKQLLVEIDRKIAKWKRKRALKHTVAEGV